VNTGQYGFFNHGFLQGHLMKHRQRIIVFLFGALLSAVAITNMRMPFVGVHWDSPIWLHQAKGYAETDYLTSMQRCGHVFLRTHPRPISDVVPDCFDDYPRLGHTILLGTVVQLLGSTVSAITATSLLFYALLTLAVLFVALMTINLHRTWGGYEQPDYLLAGILVSLFLCVSSELFSYLGNSFVSDVPSLAFVSAAAFTLIQGLTRRSHWRLALSGIFSFLAYATRVESIWAYISLMLALALILLLRRRKDTWWSGFLIAGMSAGIPFVAYLAAFFPLGDPTLYLAWARDVSKSYFSGTDAYGFEYFVRAGGLLWVGSLIFLASKRRSIGGEIALLWLFLLAIPWIPWMFQQGPTQTRHYVLLIMPLLVLSSLGWAAALQEAKVRPSSRWLLWMVLPLVCLLSVVSHTHNYRWARQIPGFYALDTVWDHWLLGPSVDEQVTYPVNEAVMLGRCLLKVGWPTTIVRMENIPLVDFLYLIRYFGPKYPRTLNFVTYENAFGPESTLPCTNLPPMPSGEPAVYVTVLSEKCRAKLRASGVRMLHLTFHEPGTAQIKSTASETVILRTQHYTVYQID
jgi:hypothetical protein